MKKLFVLGIVAAMVMGLAVMAGALRTQRHSVGWTDSKRDKLGPG